MDNIIVARRIADRVALAYLGDQPDADDPARDSWLELYGEIVKAAEDEVGRAHRDLGQDRDSWRRVAERLESLRQSCHESIGTFLCDDPRCPSRVNGHLPKLCGTCQERSKIAADLYPVGKTCSMCGGSGEIREGGEAICDSYILPCPKCQGIRRHSGAPPKADATA